MNPGSEDKPLSDPSYNARDFRRQLFGGSLRWLATVLALASLGLLIFFLVDGKEPQIDFPIHLQGKVVLWVVGIAFAIWLALAVVNWNNWFQKKKARR